MVFCLRYMYLQKNDQVLWKIYDPTRNFTERVSCCTLCPMTAKMGLQREQSNTTERVTLISTCVYLHLCLPGKSLTWKGFFLGKAEPLYCADISTVNVYSFSKHFFFFHRFPIIKHVQMLWCVYWLLINVSPCKNGLVFVRSWLEYLHSKS